MIEEVRRQFREIPGLLEGTGTADYRRCIDISTAASLREMVLPGLLAVAVPVVVGLLSLYALGGLLVGVTASGVLMALFQSNAGGAWDNAKKYVEAGNHGEWARRPTRLLSLAIPSVTRTKTAILPTFSSSSSVL